MRYLSIHRTGKGGTKENTLTIYHILSLHSFFRVLLHVLLVNCQTPRLCLQVLGIRLQISPHCCIVSI